MVGPCEAKSLVVCGSERSVRGCLKDRPHFKILLKKERYCLPTQEAATTEGAPLWIAVIRLPNSGVGGIDEPSMHLT